MAPKLDLLPRYAEGVLGILDEQVPEAEVWAFGSRVVGGAHEGSDLDLVLRNPGDLSAPLSGLGALKEALSQSTIPILVEVHDWALLPEAFHEEIEKKSLLFRAPVKPAA
ncbi:nucleotidyltransferase domain-containing protein [Microbulbifer sp. HZ11]|uniref:nucleotidyltransferase domain-containing protein n=1 Tax=Microbulbifer sp. HZ11 TaxID=1453501 RepID=UPI0005B7F239|nr:nucleotidyltransferase domain-containing protein [Microbulbifer sp. HZ11]